MFLSPDDLHELTGRMRKGAQVAWLRHNRWRFVLDADGNPKVSRAYFDHRMTGIETPEPGARPNFEAV